MGAKPNDQQALFGKNINDFPILKANCLLETPMRNKSSNLTKNNQEFDYFKTIETSLKDNKNAREREDEFYNK